MRHALLRFVCAGLLAAALAVPGFAAGTNSLTVQRPAAQGGTLHVTLSLNELSGSANAALCKVGYNSSQLKLESASILPADGQAAGTARGSTLKTDKAGTVSAEWHDLDSQFTGGGFLTMEFTALTDVTETNLQINEVQLAAMQNGAAKTITAKSAGAAVSGGVQPGDLNGNGEIDSGDLTKLCRLLADLETSDFQMTQAGDLNGNGEIDSGDLTKLCRLIAELDALPDENAEFSCRLN